LLFFQLQFHETAASHIQSLYETVAMETGHVTRLVPSVLDDEANRKPVNLEHVVDVNILREVGTVCVHSNFSIDRCLK